MRANDGRGHRVERAVLVALAAAGLALVGCTPTDHTPTGREPDGAPPAARPDPNHPPAPNPATAPTPGAGTGVIAYGRPGWHRIALTFDSNMTTAMLHRLDTGQVDSYANAAVIDELRARNVPATFFLSGLWVERYPELTRRIAAEPEFELASHSYAHRGFTAHCYRLDPLPVAEMASDVERSFAVLSAFGGHQTRYFRFPGGCYDHAALTAIAPAGATVVQYDDVGGDAFTHDPTVITDNVLRQAHDGAIVVLHITKANAPATADALPHVVDGLRAKGYRLVTLSELLLPGPGVTQVGPEPVGGVQHG